MQQGLWAGNTDPAGCSYGNPPLSREGWHGEVNAGVRCFGICIVDSTHLYFRQSGNTHIGQGEGDAALRGPLPKALQEQ